MKFIQDKKQFAWIMYDWANSAFATTVMAGFFPIFFKNYWSLTADVNISTFYLGAANSIASLMVALLAPILGAIADQGNRRKRYLIYFAYMGVLMTGSLFMVEMGNWKLALFLYIMGTVGFSGANIFYDSLLPDITNEKKIDYVSAKGYAYGYLGGGFLFLLNVLWFTNPSIFGFDIEYESAVSKILNNDSNIQIFIDEKKFNFENNENFEAILTSHYYSKVKNIDNFKVDNTHFASIIMEHNENIDWTLIDNTINFGKYINAEFVTFDDKKIELVVKNPTRKITKNSMIDICINNKIIIGNYKNGIGSNITNLTDYYDDITLRTDRLVLAKKFLPVRLSFLSVAFWWGIFTIPLIFWIQEKKNTSRSKSGHYIKRGFKQLYITFGKIKHMKYIFTFLIAYWLYIDGVNTVIRMAVDYGMSIGLPSSSLIIALLITQFVGFPSALLFGKLGENWSPKNLLFIGIFVYLGITLWAVFMEKVWEFYLMAIIIGLVQGGIQSLSRSLYTRLIPKNQSAEYFGFFNMTGKFAAIFGPVLIGGINIVAKMSGFTSNISTRIGIGSISILFIGGAIFLYFVDIDQGKKSISNLEMY